MQALAVTQFSAYGSTGGLSARITPPWGYSYAAFQDHGAVAQLGERRVRNAKVGSSILLGSTKTHNSPDVRLAIFDYRNRVPVAQLDRASAS